MAWIKVETITPDKPELLHIAGICNCSQGEAFLAWFRFYAWADSVTDDGFIKLLTPGMVDRYAGLQGFGQAMSDVDWIQYLPTGGTIAKFDRHNGKSAKRRAMDAERKALVRKLSAPNADKNRTHVRTPCGHNADQRREEESR